MTGIVSSSLANLMWFAELHVFRTANYNALRKATNTSFPGYLSHEAVVWHPGKKEAFLVRSEYLLNAAPEKRKWLFLPRKASENIPYDEQTDEHLASNLLLIVDEDFSHVEVTPFRVNTCCIS